MTPEEQRIAIAEFCGYRLEALPQNPKQRTWHKDGVTAPLPNYLNDLNAMHEAEKLLRVESGIKYRMLLSANSDGPRAEFLTSEAAICHATAAQRAKAFLRTIGKWKEGA